jgi:hypothetical protein
MAEIQLMAVAMANRQQPFKTFHVARALRGAVAAGVKDPRVEVRLPTGASIIVGGKPDAAAIPKSSKAPTEAGQLSRRGRK